MIEAGKCERFATADRGYRPTSELPADERAFFARMLALGEPAAEESTTSGEGAE